MGIPVQFLLDFRNAFNPRQAGHHFIAQFPLDKIRTNNRHYYKIWF